MRVELLGQVRVVHDDRALPALGAHAQIVLAMLAVEHDRAIAQDELAEVLWPGRTPRSWESMLRTAVSRVRTIFASLSSGEDALATISAANGCYRLDLPPDSSIDTHDATGLLDAALSDTLAGDDEAARDHAAAARRMLTRQFLPGLSAVWIDLQRDRLGSALVQTLEVLSSAHARLGETSAAVATAREAIALQPLRESSHRTLMAAHVAAGNRAEGVRAYERTRKLLMDELGVHPAPETEALYSSLIDSVPRVPPVVSLPPVPPALLTAAPFGFVNRVREQSALLRAAEAARAGQCHLVLVSGEGGSGKSQLIAELARQLAARRTAILYSRCVEDGEGNWPVINCLREWAAASPDAVVEKVLGRWVGEVSRFAPELGTRLRHASQPLLASSDGDANDGSMLEAVASWVQSLAASYPVVLVVEDLQWASERTFAVLRYLLAAAPPRTLVLASYRSTETVVGHPVSAALAEIVCMGQLCTRVELKSLGVIDVAEMLGAALGNDLDESDLALAHRIQRETAGNVYLVEHMIRQVAESAHRGDAEPSDVLSGLDRPLRRLLARLPVDLADYLLAAAVVGAEFDADDLHTLAGVEPEVGGQLTEQLIERGLLVPVDESTRRMRFVHPIVRDAIFQHVSRLHSHRVLHRYLDERRATGTAYV